MKIRKSILEAINRGIQLALDDYEDDELISSSKSNIIKNIDTKELWDLYNQFIDLGLPSGILWAKYNLGCDWNKLNIDPEHTKPEDWHGDYYAWGEIEPKDNYDWNTYKFSNNSKLTKYNKEDGLTELQLEDDAAYQFDNRMKMPTKEQFEELLKYTINEQIKNYQGIKGLNGILLTSKINGKQMFIPAAGYKYQDFLTDDGIKCEVWSSSLNTGYTYHGFAWGIFFSLSKHIYIDDSVRGDGHVVRPVRIDTITSSFANKHT